MLRRRFKAVVSGAAVGGLAAAMLVVGAPPASATPGPTTVVSLDAAGDPISGANQPVISGDGNVVVFQAENHVWARNRTAGTTERVDVLPGGTGGMNGAYDVNDDGRYVVFDAVWYDGDHCTAPPPERHVAPRGAVRSTARVAVRTLSLSDPFLCTAVFRRDLQTDTTILVSTSDDESTRGDGASQAPTISADGNRIAFDSTAPDLTVQVANADGAVYVRDVTAGSTVLASVNSDEQVANNYSQNSRISANGEFVVFGTAATNIYLVEELEGVKMFIRYLNTGDTWPVDRSLQGWVPVAINGDATRAAVATTQRLMHEDDPEDTDRTLYVIERTAEDGGDVFKLNEGQEISPLALHLSDDGRYLGMVLGPQDRVYVWDLQEMEEDYESVRSDGTAVDAGGSFGRLVSDDGRFVAFGSMVDDVTPDDVDDAFDVFVHDRALPTQSASGTGSASTDSGSGPTVADPMVASVSGSPGNVTVEELQAGVQYTGYAVLGQAVSFTVDPPTPPAFLTFTFEIDATAVPSGDPSDVDVLREGVALTDCSTASDPGPCVASRSALPSGDWRFVAHSPQASTWAVATPIGAGPPTPDTTDPTVDLRTPVNGATYAQGQSVQVDYDCADTGGAGLFSCVGDQADGASLDTSTPGAHSFTVTATDNAGNDKATTSSYTVQAQGDTTKPTITLTRPANGAAYTLGSVVKASFSCADTGGSGLVSCVGTRANGANLPTGSIGSRTFTVTAKDGAGNTTTRTAGYSIVWPLTAFIAPVDNPPVVNLTRAGRTIPVRFSLGGNRGSAVFESGYPRSAPVACPSGPSDEIETTLSGNPPTLSYGSGRYTYAWRTSTSWASQTTCRALTVRFADGQQRTAIFKLR